MNKLIIDTTNRDKTKISLNIEKKIDEIESLRAPKSQSALLMIERILAQNHIAPNEIDEVIVNTGPGSFTGTRVGVAIANALGFGLNTKLNGRKGKTAIPSYK